MLTPIPSFFISGEACCRYCHPYFLYSRL